MCIDRMRPRSTDDLVQFFLPNTCVLKEYNCKRVEKIEQDRPVDANAFDRRT